MITIFSINEPSIIHSDHFKLQNTNLNEGILFFRIDYLTLIFNYLFKKLLHIHINLYLKFLYLLMKQTFKSLFIRNLIGVKVHLFSFTKLQNFQFLVITKFLNDLFLFI